MSSTKSFRIICAAGATVVLLFLFRWFGVDSRSAHFFHVKLHSSEKPRYIFVDLGANSADSLEVFLKHKGTKFEWDFPSPSWSSHNQAEIFLFEANPHFNTALLNAKANYTSLGHKITIFPSTVVDTKDSTRTFFLDTVNTANEFWGSSIFANHPDVMASQSTGTELTSVNIARWLLMNTLPQDFVVVKMDIEGAEYEIIPHMATMHAGLVIDYLYIEWHQPEMAGGTPEEVAGRRALADAACEKLKADGTEIPIYDSPA